MLKAPADTISNVSCQRQGKPASIVLFELSCIVRILRIAVTVCCSPFGHSRLAQHLRDFYSSMVVARIAGILSNVSWSTGEVSGTRCPGDPGFLLLAELHCKAPAAPYLQTSCRTTLSLLLCPFMLHGKSAWNGTKQPGCSCRKTPGGAFWPYLESGCVGTTSKQQQGGNTGRRGVFM